MLNEFIPYTACPLCQSTAFIPKVRADCSHYVHFKPPLSPIMQWLECVQCKHVFRDGFYTDEAFNILLHEIHPSQRVGYDYERQRLIWSRMIERVLPYRTDGIWLDVGFGSGALLLTAAEFGFRPFGVDLRQPNVDALNALGIQAARIDFTTLNITPKAAVISLCDVLEHMQFPLAALAAAHRNLADDGVLLISLPNRDSPLWQLLDRANKNPYWAEMEHFHNFGRTSLYRILAQSGFIPIQYGISERYRVCMEIIAKKAH